MVADEWVQHGGFPVDPVRVVGRQLRSCRGAATIDARGLRYTAWSEPPSRARTPPIARKGPNGIAVRRDCATRRDEREPDDCTQYECEEQPDGDVPQSLPGDEPAEHGSEADVAVPESAPRCDVQHSENGEGSERAHRRPQHPLRLAHEDGDRGEQHDADRQGHVHKPTGQGLGRQIDERQHHERGDEEEIHRELGPRAEVKRRRGEAKRGDRRDSSLRMLPVASVR